MEGSLSFASRNIFTLYKQHSSPGHKFSRTHQLVIKDTAIRNLIKVFMLACPLSAAVSRAARWDQLKTHIQDVARNYCSTFHADRTRQLRALRVQAGLARAAYLADPTSQPALDQLRSTAADLQQHRQQQAATVALRAGVLLHEYGDQSTYYFHHLHRQRQRATIISSLQQQPDSQLADFFFFFFFFGWESYSLHLRAP